PGGSCALGGAGPLHTAFDAGDRRRWGPRAGVLPGCRRAQGSRTRGLSRREFGSDLLAGISIVASVLLGEYLAGSVVVLMLSGGEASKPLPCAAPHRGVAVLDL